MAARITHITLGKAGVHAESSAELAEHIGRLTDAGYLVDNIEDDPDEPIHAATVHYTGGPQTLRLLKQIVA